MPAIGEARKLTRRVWIGIDPGASGGLAAIVEQVNGAPGIVNPVVAVGMPETEKDVWDWIRAHASILYEPFAVIEKVGGFIKEDYHVRGMGHSMFQFGRSYGFLRGCLTAAGVPFVEVQPQVWQKALKIPARKQQAKTAWKNRLKAAAQQLFPDLTITLKTADALLIAEFCRQMRNGLVPVLQ